MCRPHPRETQSVWLFHQNLRVIVQPPQEDAWFENYRFRDGEGTKFAVRAISEGLRQEAGDKLRVTIKRLVREFETSGLRRSEFCHKLARNHALQQTAPGATPND